MKSPYTPLAISDFSKVMIFALWVSHVASRVISSRVQPPSDLVTYTPPPCCPILSVIGSAGCADMHLWAARSGLHAGLHGCAAQRLPSLTAWINGTSTMHALCKAMCGLSVSISYDMRFWCVVVVRRRISKGVVCGAVCFGWVLCVLCGAVCFFVRLQVFRSSVVLAAFSRRFWWVLVC